jgi:hypothetical protein
MVQKILALQKLSSSVSRSHRKSNLSIIRDDDQGSSISLYTCASIGNP